MLTLNYSPNPSFLVCGSSFFLGKSQCWLTFSLPFSPSNYWLILKFSSQWIFPVLHLNALIKVFKNFIVQSECHVVLFTCRSKLGIVWTLSTNIKKIHCSLNDLWKSRGNNGWSYYITAILICTCKTGRKRTKRALEFGHVKYQLLANCLLRN